MPPTLKRTPVAYTSDHSRYEQGTDPSPVTTPQPIQSGMTTRCNRF
jgi:hypothetical protein